MPAIEQSETGGCRYLIAEFMRGGTEEKRIVYACRHGEWEIVFASFEGVESEITLAFSPSSNTIVFTALEKIHRLCSMEHEFHEFFLFYRYVRFYHICIFW